MTTINLHWKINPNQLDWLIYVGLWDTANIIYDDVAWDAVVMHYGRIGYWCKVK